MWSSSGLWRAASSVDRLFLRKCTLGWKGSGFQGHLEPETFQPFHKFLLEPAGMALVKVICTQVAIFHWGLENVIGDHKYGVCDCDVSDLHSLACHAPEQRRQVAVLLRRHCPCALAEVAP